MILQGNTTYRLWTSKSVLTLYRVFYHLSGARTALQWYQMCEEEPPTALLFTLMVREPRGFAWRLKKRMHVRWTGMIFFEVWRGWKIGRIGESFLLKPREWIELFLPADWSEEEHQWCGLEVERGSTSPPNHENPHREGNHLLLLLLWYPWLGCILIIQVNARSDVFDVNNCGWLSDKIIRCKKCGT